MMKTKNKDGSDVRKGQIDVLLSKENFTKNFLTQFFDPTFQSVKRELDKVIEVAWNNYKDYRKSPLKKKAGPNYSKPSFELPIEWLETSRALKLAEKKQKNLKSKSRILIICASSRNDQTCPGEMSKTFRLAKIAQRNILKNSHFEVDFLDLSRLTAEYGKKIFPCKSCVSTSMPLCNWPCSCYPNHAVGQTGDWMAEIYQQWVLAHGVMIVTPVNWYQAPSVLKLMIDRLVCADGGNSDPTLTSGKNPEKAKALELKGWDYPKHLAGRAFSVIVHGDSAGVENLRRIIVDWLTDMGLIQAGKSSILNHYIGYFKSYATSHQDLDDDKDFQRDVQIAASSLVKAVQLIRKNKWPIPDKNMTSDLQK